MPRIPPPSRARIRKGRVSRFSPIALSYHRMPRRSTNLESQKPDAPHAGQGGSGYLNVGRNAGQLPPPIDQGIDLREAPGRPGGHVLPDRELPRLPGGLSKVGPAWKSGVFADSIGFRHHTALRRPRLLATITLARSRRRSTKSQSKASRSGDSCFAVLEPRPRDGDGGHRRSARARPRRRSKLHRAPRVRALRHGGGDMTTICIPPVMRTETARSRDVQVVGETGRDAIDALLVAFPDLASAYRRKAGSSPSSTSTWMVSTSKRSTGSRPPSRSTRRCCCSFPLRSTKRVSIRGPLSSHGRVCRLTGAQLAHG